MRPSSRPSASSASHLPLGMTRREGIRLLILFVFGAAIAGVVLTNTFDRSEAPPTPVYQPAPDPNDPGPSTGPANLVVAVPPWRPPVERLDAMLDESAPTNRVKTQTEALNLLALLVRDRPHRNFRDDPEFKSVGGYERVPDLRPLLDPATARRYRARPIEIVGRVLRSGLESPEELGLDPKEFPLPALAGVLEVEGLEVEFLHVMGLDAKNETKVELPIPGMIVKVVGVFFRLRDEIAAGASTPTTRPVILAKRVVTALSLKARDTLPPDADIELQHAEQQSILRPPHEDPVFFDVLGYVLAKEERVVPEGEEPLSLASLEPLYVPDKYRLKPVKVRGHVMYLGEESFELEEMRPEDAPILGYWHAIVADGNPQVHVPISLVIPTKELPPELAAWAAALPAERRKLPLPYIECVGLYYRVHAFLAVGDKASGRRETRMPLVIAAGPLHSVPAPKPVDPQPFWWWVFAGLGALVLVFVLMLVRDRRRARVLDSELRSARTQRRKSRGMDLNRDLKLAPPGPRPPDRAP